jgi:hypothetical protein
MRAVRRQASILALLVGLSVLISARVPAPQQPGQPEVQDPGTAFVLGRVMDAGTDKGLSGVTVTLSSATPPTQLDFSVAPASLSRLPLRALTNGSGQFVFRDLPAGSYLVLAEKAGYGSGALGRRSALESANQALTLGVGERKGDVALRLWKTASIGGAVVDEGGEPIVGLQVRAMAREMQAGRIRIMAFGSTGTTDDRGVYRIPGLRPGEYIVGIVSTQATVPSALQEATRNLPFTDPIIRELERSNGSGIVNSAGQRIGDWLLVAPVGSAASIAPVVRSDRVFVYPTTFHPAAAQLSQATVLTLASGEDRPGIDLQLRPVPTYRVSGQLTGAEGPEVFTTVELIAAGAEDMQRDSDLATGTALTDRTGAFVFMGVPSGSYTARVLKLPARTLQTTSSATIIQTGSTTISTGGGLSAPPPIPDTPTFSASVPVAVNDADVSGLMVRLQPGARLTGRLVFDGTAAKPTVDQLRTAVVQIDRADGRTVSANQFAMTRATVDQEGRFKTYQMPPGRYTVRVQTIGSAWNLKSAVFKELDIADAPIDLGSEDVGDVVITMTDRPSSLSGTVRNSRGADSTTTVFVFPAAQALWNDHGMTPRRFRTARAGTDGGYRVPSLPPGDYLVAAITSVPPLDWMDPRFLQKLAALATRVSIAEGDKKVQDVESKEVR